MLKKKMCFFVIWLFYFGLYWFDLFFGLEVVIGKLVLILGLYVFGDLLVDVGNNNYLLIFIVKVNYLCNGVDFFKRKVIGRFFNGKNVIDFIGECYIIIFMFGMK